MDSPALTIPEMETNHSDSEVRLNEQQADAVAQKIGVYHGFRVHVIDYLPNEHMGVLPLLLMGSNRALPNVGLGSLDRLPVELVHQTLLHLDISSLIKLRQTNLRAREMVNSLPGYQAVVSHGINLCRAVLQTGLASRVTLSSFYDILCTKECSFCSNFGRNVSIFIWKRCCFECLHSRPETQIRCLSWVQR
ncbi:uncharacterized protein N7506_008316 [Penicillium brevicompactum]|uniref:uncharacterized protein n=1 Tax=Penicillium brevicompactum TaxID=5074 RepID=UPI0025404888|nr:uncharacterized protein N7506_008316 [Penicillium brevicompactum]KAJ5325214.1 hypothetical protein N7506_008316 [Penicillium brevicompactum]